MNMTLQTSLLHIEGYRLKKVQQEFQKPKLA